MLALLGGALAAAAPGPVPDAASPQAYLLRALRLLRAHSIDRERLDWPRTEADAVRATEGFLVPSQTYPVIRKTIADLGNPHTVLLDPSQAQPPAPAGIPVPRSRAADAIATLVIPGFVADPAGERRYLDAGIAALRSVQAQASCGWIVDLRRNTGGDMWPMLTVLAPLLGDGDIGSFAGPGIASRAWSVRGGQALLDGTAEAETNPVRLSRPKPPIAVLTSRDTGSSGEMTLIALRGLGRSAVFGAPTAGYATGNEVYPLADGAKLLVTTSVAVDRTGRACGNSPIPPDFPSADPEAAARNWLRARCG